MLFPSNQALFYIGRLREVEVLSEFADSEYAKEMIRQLIAFFESGQELTKYGHDSESYNRAARIVGEALSTVDKIRLHSVEIAHFEAAKLLREYSFWGFHNFNETEMVQFYLCRKFDHIPQEKIDEIKFGVPERVLLAKLNQKRDEIHSLLIKIEEIEKRQNEWGSKAKESIEEWGKRLGDSEGRYRDILDGHNYLGLAHAFSGMINKKTEEANVLRLVMFFLAVLTLAIPIIQLFWGLKIYEFSDVKMPVVSTTLFSIAAEVVLIYYFRLCHLRWVSTKNQVAQLELRHSMCAFVQDYANKSKELNRDTLIKFENLIFAEVISDAAPPPSIYDAVDSIAKLLAAWKKPGA